ncbi:MAG: 23S rRNA (guanosine(2251)-2'-O)-methyltransferase RlmB [Bacillota bacterium]|jgi:23S rRNA (guanosine2251-2'-O)-methyltransferase|nr:23S rRNA (guanosine(2251)-2'-O)-methyltransferase RlmB [Candidatus Fermentithermobacillaceae bacterium]
MAGTRKTIHIYGKQPVNEAVESGWPVVEIIVRGKGDDRQVRPILDKARDRNIKISGMEPRDFDLRYAKASQGIAARVGDVVFKHPEQLLAGVPRNQTPLFVALDGIQDPQNLGSICRTSHAMGVHGLVVPRRRTAPFGEGAFKASAGAVFYLPISEVPNIHHFVQWCKKNGVWVCGLDGTADTSLWDMDLTVPLALVVGSEGKGISRLVRERCDYLARIPMSGKIDSLNAAVACGMALYEVQRQRVFRGD